MTGATKTFADFARAAGRDVPGRARPVVCVQGLGFVGAAMSIAVAAARSADGAPAYDVIGVDLAGGPGQRRVDALNAGRFPFETTDALLVDTLGAAHATGNLVATTDVEAYAIASVVVVDIPFDVNWATEPPSLRWESFRAGITTLARTVQAGTLVMLESTVPPGTTARVVAPIFAKELAARGMAPGAVHIAHSYERVMPGRDYLHSIVNFWRVYAGHTPAAADACGRFLASVIHTEKFPLVRLTDTTASELAKVLENAYRATTIAFMEEWGRFAETVGVDLFAVVDAIRMRPTHSNMRTPGFGVGGYCLTKDPLFGTLAARDLFGYEAAFPFSSMAVEVNREAPRVSADRVEALLGGSLDGRTIALLGISYRQDVGDTRYSPSETFARAALERGATLRLHDPLVAHWDEMGLDVPAELPSADGVDAVVLAVPHDVYRDLDFERWLGGRTPLVFDGFSVLTTAQRERLRALGCRVVSVGRGEAV